MKYQLISGVDYSFLIVKTNRTHLKLLFSKNNISLKWQIPEKRHDNDDGIFVYRKKYLSCITKQWKTFKQVLEAYPELMLL